MDTKRVENWATQIPNKSWFPWLALALITLLAAALRFFRLGEWSFWIDEIYTINHAKMHFGNLELILQNIPPARNWVPVSVILTAQVLNIFGVSEWSARLVSAVIGILTIPILYFPMKKIFGNQVTLIALLLLAVSPWHVFWSQNARFYTSLMLFSTLALLAFYYGIEKNRPGYFLLFYAMFYLASSERTIAFFILPVVFFYLLSFWLLPMEKPRIQKRMAYLLVLPIIAFALVEIRQYISIGSALTVDFLDTFFGQVNTDPLRLALSIIYKIGVPVFTLAIFCGIYILLIKQRINIFVLISATLPSILLVLLSIFFFTVDRYIFTTYFFWLILAGIAINALLQHADGYAKLLSLGVLSILLFSSVSEMYLYYQFQNGNRPNWKEAYKYIEQNQQNGDIVYTTRQEVGGYYLSQADNQDINAFDPTLISNRENRNYWFIIDENTGSVDPDIASWIQNNCLLIHSEEVFLPGKSMSIRIHHCPAGSNFQ
jgi:mannosyltransferase